MEELSDGLIRFGTITWKGVMSYIKDKYYESPIYTVTEEFLPRVKADLTIRRIKLKDIEKYGSNKMKTIVKWAYANLGHLDIILVTNLVLWAEMWGLERLIELTSLGVFNELESMQEKFDKLSAWIKRFPNDEEDVKQMFAEFTCLIGYLQNDIGAWDYKTEFENLAIGGNEHINEKEWEKIFMQRLNVYMTNQEKPEYMNFEAYIRSNKWLTSGSSSIGKVEWEYADETGKFKAGKTW